MGTLAAASATRFLMIMQLCILCATTGDLIAMRTLTITARGQVTFRKDILKHLGVQPGGKVSVDLLPDGRAELRAETQVGYGTTCEIISGRSNTAKLSIDDVSDAIADAGGIAGRAGLARK
jgi:bifunctional DNA-binding transcriptional regulator/antitoxin component of YhaV-PrlF toxin-antitoxin module